MRFSRFRSDILMCASLLAVIVYFAWQQFLSPGGIASLATFDSRKQGLSQELSALTAKRLALETQVALLRQESLDPDMLDEKARSILGLAGKDDIIVTLKP